MAKKYAKPTHAQTSAKAAPAAAPAATTEEVDRLKKFLADNQYYIFLVLLLGGIGFGIYYYERMDRERRAEEVSRELDSTRRSPLLDSEKFQPEDIALDRVAEDSASFVETDLAKEDVDALKRIVEDSRDLPIEPWVRYHLANRYHAAGDYDEAIREYEAIIDGFSEKGHVLLDLEAIKKDLESAKEEKAFSSAAPAPAAENPDRPRLKVETTAGTFVVELASDQAPRLSGNVLALARSGYYEGMSFYMSARVPFGSNEPFGVGAGSPWGQATGGPAYTFPKENVHAPVDEGAVLADSEGDDSSSARLWFVREKKVDDPGELAARFEAAGISPEDRRLAERFEEEVLRLYQQYARDQYNPDLYRLIRQQKMQEMTEGQRKAHQLREEYWEQKQLHETFVTKVEGYRLARSRILEGKYSVVGRVVDGIDVLRRLEPESDFILRVQQVTPSGP